MLLCPVLVWQPAQQQCLSKPSTVGFDYCLSACISPPGRMATVVRSLLGDSDLWVHPVLLSFTLASTLLLSSALQLLAYFLGEGLALLIYLLLTRLLACSFLFSPFVLHTILQGGQPMLSVPSRLCCDIDSLHYSCPLDCLARWTCTMTIIPHNILHP